MDCERNRHSCVDNTDVMDECIIIMALAVDSVTMLMNQLSREFKVYDDWLVMIGLFYVGKFALSTTWSFIDGLKAHLVPRIWSTVDLVSRYGKWAVITGATDGIGKAYAQELARRGLNLFLISRNIEKLTTVAEELENEFGIETRILDVDFSLGRPVYERIAEALESVDVGILVNNVGVMMHRPMYLTEMAEDDIWNHININIGAATMMTRIVLPKMDSKRKGAIVNLSSASAIGPIPLLNVYAATKVYVEHFSQALNYEYKSRGITVQTLSPSYVRTRMVSYSPILENGGFMVPTPSLYARNAVATLGISDRTAGYWLHGFQNWLISWIPTSVWIPMTGMLQKYFRKEYLELKDT